MALTAAAGGNISGSGVDMLQAATVNYMQSLATQEVKIIADRLDSEVARTALHAVVACAGAAAQRADCGSGALGAASSVVINNLVEQISGQAGASLTPAEKEARKNLVSSLISGVTAASGGEAAIANTAAQIESENNAFWIPVIMGAAWLIDRGMTAYDAYQDIQALRSGEKTIEQLAMEKGEDYIAQVLVGNVGKYGLKIVRHGGDWVMKKLGDKVETPPVIGSSNPYSSRDIRGELESKHGAENVTSATVPPLDKPNVKLAGQHKVVELPDGSKVRVVFDQKGFPIFDDFAKFDTRLDIDAFRNASYERQLRMATRDLRAQIDAGNVSAGQFSSAQIKAIRGGMDKIPGYTWHHHQDTGRMQLVPEAIHSGARHVGWESMSKGQ